MSVEKSAVDLSVILVTYNRDEVLQQTLECLLKQAPAPREVIVVDQSRIHKADTQRFLEQLISTRQIVYLQQSEPNAQRARNRAIAEARGEVLLFVDDDVRMDCNLVAAHWENYSDPDTAAVCGFYLEPGEKPLDQLPDDYYRPITGWLYLPHCYTKRVQSHLLPTCNGSIRRQVAIHLGGFDENYTYTHFDDTDFSCRLKQLGVKAVHDPEAKLIHLKEQSGGKRPGGINEYVIADTNRWYIWCYFFWMNFGWKSWREMLIRLRGCVFRRKNFIRPWYLAIALTHFLHGACRAATAIRAGRKLGLAGFSDKPQSAIAQDLPPVEPGQAVMHKS